MTSHPKGRVCAFAVTFNRRDLLRECLHSLQNADCVPDEIYIINNASSDGTREMLELEFPHLPALHLPENEGASRGYYEGFKYGFENGFDWVWVVDDEGYAQPDCLAKMLDAAPPNSVVSPLKQDSGGRFYGIHTWNGRNFDIAPELVGQSAPLERDDFLFDFTATLFARSVITKAGYPNKRFVIWFDDFEYAFRAKRKARARILAVPDALFFHDFGKGTRQVRFLGRTSFRSEQPAWKTYYGARNPLYTLLKRRQPKELALFFLVQTRLLLMDIAFEKDRFARARLRLKGWADALSGRLGKRVMPGSGRNRS